MNHAISINSDKTLVITLPEGTQVDRVMIRKMGTQESKLYWRDEVLDQYKWERDIAIQQLKELGYGFGQEPKTDGDTISRKAAVSRISDLLILELKGERIPTWNEVYSALNELPSVQPKIIRCEECEWLDTKSKEKYRVCHNNNSSWKADDYCPYGRLRVEQ